MASSPAKSSRRCSTIASSKDHALHVHQPPPADHRMGALRPRRDRLFPELFQLFRCERQRPFPARFGAQQISDAEGVRPCWHSGGRCRSALHRSFGVRRHRDHRVEDCRNQTVKLSDAASIAQGRDARGRGPRDQGLGWTRPDGSHQAQGQAHTGRGDREAQGVRITALAGFTTPRDSGSIAAKPPKCSKQEESMRARQHLHSTPHLRPPAALAAAIAIALLSSATSPAAAQSRDKVFELKLSHWVPPNHPLQKALEDWGAAVEKASGGTLKYKVFPAQQLGKAFDHYDMARDGIADVTYVNPGYQPGRFPIIAAGELPFLMS